MKKFFKPHDFEDEAKHLEEIVGNPKLSGIYQLLLSQFQVLQTRSQTLLSLVTITLTITGFSGPTIAKSGKLAALLLAIGLALALASAFVIIIGVLPLFWLSQGGSLHKKDEIENWLVLRNRKTSFYFLGLVLLVLGLSTYASSIIIYLIKMT